MDHRTIVDVLVEENDGEGRWDYMRRGARRAARWGDQPRTTRQRVHGAIGKIVPGAERLWPNWLPVDAASWPITRALLTTGLVNGLDRASSS